MKMDVNSSIKYGKLKDGLAFETMGGGGGRCGYKRQKRSWICQSFSKNSDERDPNKMDLNS